MYYNTRYVHVVYERHDFQISRIFDVNFANFTRR